MIGRLSGTVVMSKPPWVLIEVNGVGYEVQISTFSFEAISRRNTQDTQGVHTVIFWIHEQIREDAHELYGFYQESERALFRLLLKTAGVGPKVALNILSAISAPRLVRAIEHNDVSVFKKVSGVGQKTAERLMLELRDRWKKQPLAFELLLGPQDTKANQEIQKIQEDAISALVHLGYKSQEAEQAVAIALEGGAGSDCQTLIRAALKAFVRS